MVIRGVEQICRAFILEVQLGALKSTLPSSNWRTRKLESQLASNNFKLDTAAVKLESLLRFTKDAVFLMLEQARSQTPKLREENSPHVAAEAGLEAANFNLQSLTASESTLWGEVPQYHRLVGELEDEVTRVRQDCDSMVQDLFFEPYGRQVRLDSTASQRSGVCKSMTWLCERLEQDHGRLEACDLWLEALIVSPVSSFVYRMASLMSDEVAALCSGAPDVVPSASDILELNSQSVGQVSRVAERVARMSTARKETSGTPSCVPLAPVTIDMRVKQAWAS